MAKYKLTQRKKNLVVNGRVVDGEFKIATVLSAQFYSVFTRDNSDRPNYHHLFQSPGPENITVNDAGSLLLLLNYGAEKSDGTNDMLSMFLKRYKEWVSKYLFVLFKALLATSILPVDWNLAIVEPPHKSGDPDEAVNYLPNFLMCITFKLFDHIIAKYIS